MIHTDHVIPERFTTHFRSAIVFGRARILNEESEIKYALKCLVEKYSPDFVTEGQAAVEGGWNSACVAEVEIEHMTGKAKIEVENG